MKPADEAWQFSMDELNKSRLVDLSREPNELDLRRVRRAGGSERRRLCLLLNTIETLGPADGVGYPAFLVSTQLALASLIVAGTAFLFSLMDSAAGGQLLLVAGTCVVLLGLEIVATALLLRASRDFQLRRVQVARARNWMLLIDFAARRR